MTKTVPPPLFITGADSLEVGRSLPAIALHIVHEVGELRALGDFPEQASVHVDVDLSHDRLDILVTGLSPETDPDRVATMTSLRAVFEIASHANVVDVTCTVAPLFTNRILAIDTDGMPYAGLIGAGIGDIHLGVNPDPLSEKRD
jgi:hypothetical protein